MRVAEECNACLDRLIVTTATLATDAPALREKALAAGRAVLKAEFAPDKIPVQIAAKAQRVIREIALNPDPFKKVKEGELALAAKVIGALSANVCEDWTGLFKLAALGNSVDFFRDLGTVASEMSKPVTFAVDEIPAFLARLEDARCLLFLTDNAAECYFDLPLFRRLAQVVAETVYVVKEAPVQNDLTLADLEASGLREAFCRVQTTGTDSPGLDLEAASPAFKMLYARADLILAKGMGYFESFSEMKDERVFHLLKAKCRPVAAALGVPQGSFVAAFTRAQEG
uniref:DUF89 family protein n=1 Tax=Ammonifex degensii TaxID=42838 RepID=A0A7C1F3C7_9THEO